MLRLSEIKKDFASKEQTTHVLKGISVQFRACEFVSILGPSGCGKTTLLNLVGGLDKCTSGEVYLDGKSTEKYSDADWNNYRNKKIGFVFQTYNLIHHLTVEKNVELPMVLSDVPKDERKRRAHAALEKVGLLEHAKKHPNQLSGGQMQRVAIARALVNNPSIILADEPTGALDSESGVQVMDILKEISADKLVIMVTHNDVLAKEYSTRIINMYDGSINGDTNPYSLEECLEQESADEIERQSEYTRRMEEGIAKVMAPTPTDENEQINKQKESRLKLLKAAVSRKLKREDNAKRRKTSMSFGTAIRLSLTNLYSKRGRSLLTSIAGSIGIIGIMLVLALSSGAKAYIQTIEENALSQYPLTIEQTNMNIPTVLKLLSDTDSDRQEYPTAPEVYTNEVLGNLIDNLDSVLSQNDLESLKVYIEENFDSKYGYVKYDYGVSFDAYCKFEEDSKYTQISPFLDIMKDFIPPVFSQYMDMMNEFAELMTVWEEMIDNQAILDQQYELVGKSKWPTAYNEVVIVVDSKNQINDYTLFALGLSSPKDLGKAFTSGDLFAATTYPVEELLQKEYRVMTGADYYSKPEDTYVKADANTATSIEFMEAHSIPLKVVGVIRPREGVKVTSINGSIAYTQALTKFLSDRAEATQIVKDQKNKTLTNVITKNEQNADAYYKQMHKFGVAFFDSPTRISLYANSFKDKDKIVAFLDEYNAVSETGIKYSDNLSMIMSYVDTLTDTITRVLIGFAGISLIVSSIMISIIIYTSVLERRKEIGVLRSVGARKKDISNVFISESGLLGLCSGAIGIGVTYLFALMINAILSALIGVPNIASVAWWSPLLMMALSEILSIMAGFVPARIASNKDPVECLRSE